MAGVSLQQLARCGGFVAALWWQRRRRPTRPPSAASSGGAVTPLATPTAMPPSVVGPPQPTIPNKHPQTAPSLDRPPPLSSTTHLPRCLAALPPPLLAVLQMIRDIKAAVTIPVMAKARIGHFVEAQILEALGIDYIDESEVGAALRWVVQGVEGGV